MRARREIGEEGTAELRLRKVDDLDDRGRHGVDRAHDEKAAAAREFVDLEDANRVQWRPRLRSGQVEWQADHPLLKGRGMRTWYRYWTGSERRRSSPDPRAGPTAGGCTGNIDVIIDMYDISVAGRADRPFYLWIED
jgi:hypothetical protein